MHQNLRHTLLTGSTLLLAAGCAFDATTDPSAESTGSAAQPICDTYPYCPAPGGGTPPAAPAPLKPDIALQFSPCLPDAFANQIGDALHAVLPDAKDLRVVCAAGNQTVGVWFAPAASTDDANARLAGLNSLAVLHSGENFGGFVNQQYVALTVYNKWISTPRRYNPDSTPNSDGPVHLTALQVNYDVPNQISSVISGYDERPWPDVDFTLTTTDAIGVNSLGRIYCQSQENLQTDITWVNYLTGVLSFAFPPLGAFLYIDDAFPSANDSPGGGAGAHAGSVACPAVSFFPGEILLPFATKATIKYTRAESSSNGIFVGGTYTGLFRKPSLTIFGNRTLQAFEGDYRAGAFYTAGPQDMREPITYTWTANGTVNAPSANITNISFPLTGPGSIGLHAVDADGLVADATASVTINVRPRPAPPPPRPPTRPGRPPMQEP